MKQIKARDLLNYTVDQLWNSLIGNFKLEFDNGEVIDTNYKETLYSRYFWEFHRKYPLTPLVPKHHLKHLLGNNKYINSKTHVKLLKNIYWDAVNVYKLHTPLERDPLTKLIYELVNYIYNDLPPRIEEYMLTLDALDFVNLVTHPDMEKVLDNVTEERTSIDIAHQDIMDILQEDPAVSENAIVKCVRFGSVNKNQVLQCVGPRGFLTEVNSEVLGKPVTRSFSQGMRTLYNIAAESRSAAKSLYYSESPLQDSEYFARQLQLMTMTIERIHYCDCGSKEFLHWTIKEPEYAKVMVNGVKTEVMTYKGDLPNLVGKYYLLETDPDDAPLKVIKASDKHLIGTTIKLRTVLHCQHPDKAGVCEVCFGEMAYNLPQNGNLGHNCSASFTSVISQSVLSTKHLDASSKSETITLSEENKKFFETDKSKIYFNLRKSLAKYKPKLLVPQKYLPGLTDINIVSDIKRMRVSHISAIVDFGIELHYPDGSMTREAVVVGQDKKKPSFTTSFLEYIKRYKWEYENNNVVFDLSMWNYNDSLMKIPELEYNYVEYQDRISKLIKSRTQDLETRVKTSPVQLLSDMFDMINHKQSINISLMEVIVYSLLSTDPLRGYSGLSRGTENPQLSVHKSCIDGRSLSAAYAFEKQDRTMIEPMSFFEYDRPDSILDAFVCPSEVMKYAKKK